MNHDLTRRRRGRIAVSAVLVFAFLAIGCAKPQPYQEHPQARRFTRDIYSCLHGTKEPTSHAITSGMANRERYNDCMKARGWERKTDSLPEVAAGS